VKLLALRTLGRAQHGAVMVEFALVAPIFLALLFGIFEFGRALWTQQALQQTAIVGARCMALPQSACASDVTYAYNSTKTMAYIQQVANQWGVSLTSADIAQNNAANCGGESGFSEVSLAITFQSVVPRLLNLPGSGIPLTATACFPNNS
jgi:Flp pilus assembly protein TadG